MEGVQTYHGKTELKRDFLAQITAHEQADALIKGSYAEIDTSARRLQA